VITVTDIFAGAGGSSSGMEDIPGVHLSLAANHWPLAVAVHAENHQQTEHACVDLHLEDPRNFPYTDILWASPECTKWSIANSQATALSVEMGGDPTLFDDVPDELISEGDDEISRSRLLMFDVLRFIEYHHYRAVVVENVVDVATQPKYGAAWRLWQQGLRRLGYLFRVVSLNSMHAQAHGAPAPQSRDRIYVVAWPEGERAPDIDSVLSPKAWCPACEEVVASRQAWKPGRTVGRYRAQYVYACDRGHPVEPGWLPASVAIDWSLQGQRIGDRQHPLSPKTMARIREGLRRYGHQFVIEAGGNQYDACDPRHPQYGNPDSYYRAWPITDPLRTLQTSITKGLVGSLLIPTEGRDGKHAAPDNAPMRTQTTRNEIGLLVPSGGTWHERAYSTKEPLRTVTTRENHGILTTLRGTNAPKPTSDPLDTVAASGNHHGLLVPYYSSSDTAKPTELPMGTLTTVDRYALVMRNNTGGAEMVTPAYEPLRTLTTAGHQSILEPSTIEPEDCTFRMLEPHEIALGMSFPADYRWQGSKRERVRLAGNAVTPPAARDLVWAVVEAITGEAA
jgi:DNA (cytosine-5)-methyltransferase 1